MNTDTVEAPASAGSPGAAGSGTVKFAYRVRAGTIRDGNRIRAAYEIQARVMGQRVWMGLNIGGKHCTYRDRETADRHCRWLNDPKGTEPEWGCDESPNAPALPRRQEGGE